VTEGRELAERMTWQAATSGAGQVQRAACAAQDARAALDASDDLTRLACDLDDAGVLEHVARRFAAARFGTFVGSVLLCVNPMREAHEPLEACGSTRAAAHPHPFASAEGAFQRLQRERRSQCIVISGESGAGKSETFKRVLQHLVGRSEASARGVEKRLLAASPILESLGNAATTSNANSSRFGYVLVYTFALRLSPADPSTALTLADPPNLLPLCVASSFACTTPGASARRARAFCSRPRSSLAPRSRPTCWNARA
jgi:myosin heavy subunit